MFNQTHDLSVRSLESLIIREYLASKGVLSIRELIALRYGFSLARLQLIEGLTGTIDLFEYIAPFRHWLIEQLAFFITNKRVTDWHGVRHVIRCVTPRISEIRDYILSREPITPDLLEKELTHRSLVLVLGGGGGSGYAHLGAFATIAELGLLPKLIVGASMGAMMGLYRSTSKDYDPISIALSMPHPTNITQVFSPYQGSSRFGFPGALSLNMRSFGTTIFNDVLGKGIPKINELPIPLRVVATGLRPGMNLMLRDIEKTIDRSRSRYSLLRTGRRVMMFSSVVQRMLAQPEHLKEIIFGSDEGLKEIDVIDAIGFSSAVPALLHYDLGEEDIRSAAMLSKLFTEQHLFRLTDGGIVSNVPSGAARKCVMEGEIGTRNTFVLALDPFAPKSRANPLFWPVQNLIQTRIEKQIKYADLHVAYHSPPSPFQVMKTFDSLQKTVKIARKNLKKERKFIALMMERLPNWSRFVAQGGIVAD